MFAYIKGSLEMKSSGYIVIDINGLGYKIFMSQNNIDSIGELHNIIKVFTYVKVREDDISIFGFKTQEELKMFELLISVSGVGAKSALVMLSCIEPSDFAIAVISNDVKVLTKVPGIGNKSAQRIILELKDKLKEEQLEEKLKDCKKPIKVAVMGCIVNGPGEAKEADIGIAGGDGCGLIFKKGEILRKVDEKDLLDELMKEIDKL